MEQLGGRFERVRLFGDGVRLSRQGFNRSRFIIGNQLSSLRGPGRRSPIACGAAGALAAIAVCWLTDYVVRYPAVLACVAVLFALVAAEARRRYPPGDYGWR